MRRANSSGPIAAPRISNELIIDQLTDKINLAIREYHDHAKDCRCCRNPLQRYEARRQTCAWGNTKTQELVKLLYTKAEYVPKGTFRISYKQGWTEIDELIRVICHNHQGEYTTNIVDLKRARPRHESPPVQQRIAAPPAPVVEAPAGRGSAYQEDLRRQQAARERERSAPRPIHHSSTNLAVYPTPTIDECPRYGTSPAGSHVSERSSNGSKTVHFDTRIKVREFETDR